MDREKAEARKRKVNPRIDKNKDLEKKRRRALKKPTEDHDWGEERHETHLLLRQFDGLPVGEAQELGEELVDSQYAYAEDEEKDES